MKRVGFAAVCALVAAGLSYQRPDEVWVSAHPYTPPPLHLSVQTQLVQLDAVVRDSRGRPVPGLTQSDFEIFDDGKPRPIAVFSVDSRLPFRRRSSHRALAEQRPGAFEPVQVETRI